MPELPDVEVFRKEAEKSKNSEIESIEIQDPDFVDITKKEFNKKLKDHKFEKIIRQGKNLFLSADNNITVAMHFGMTGELKYREYDEDVPKYTKCSFVFRNDHKLHYTCTRKLGYIELTDDLDKYVEGKELGVDALEITGDEFVLLLKEKNSMVKSAITDQSKISGIGNIYSDEILFQSGIHPKKHTNELSESDMKRLFKNTRRVLKKAIEKEADVLELPKSYLLPHRKEGDKCPKCDTKIKKIKVSGRSAYYCPSCQKY